jgi:cyclopropane-fatty-acyl-phospholipid synthase
MVRESLSAPTSATLRHTAALLDRLFPPPRSFALRLWDGRSLPAPAGASFTLVLNHPGAPRRMFTPPLELSLAEAFISGDFEIEGDIFPAIGLFDDTAARRLSLRDLTALARELLSLPKPVKRQGGRGAAQLRGGTHSPERDRAAIQYHYDIGNDFYALWLDGRMQYSCAYFPTGLEDLDTAQEHKLDYLCRKLRLQRGERLLDLGCGWGGLAMYAAEHYGVHVLGVTLSEQQAYYANMQIARAGLESRTSVKLCDYRDIGANSFDKIVSVGMFEDVGARQLPEYFAHTYRLLKPGGLFLNHGIARRPPAAPKQRAGTAACCPPTRVERKLPLERVLRRWLMGEGTFVERYVFPDGELVPVSFANLAAERAGFEVRDVENLREHYVRTLRQWVTRLEALRDKAVAISDEATYRTYRLYMAASAHSFETGAISIHQTLLSKPAGDNSFLPLTHADLYMP